MPVAEDKIVAVILRERNELLAYINSFLTDVHLAEDCLQEVTAAALSNRNTFDDETHVIRWTLRVARNKAIDFSRKRQRQPRTLPEDVLDLIENQWAAEVAARPSEPAALVDYLEQCLESLSQYGRQLVELRYFDGLSSASVAGVVGKKIETVYQALSRVHITLRECVERKMASERGGVSAL